MEFKSNKIDLVIKILMIGDSNVGKSCLLLRYCDNHFSPTFITTIGIDFKIKNIDVNNKKIKMQIWDTAGQERFRTITASYFRGGQAACITYDVTNKESFEHVKLWIDELQRNNSKVDMFLIANKVDLNRDRVVSKEEGERLAKKNNMIYFECSAKSGLNVDEMFFKIAELVSERLFNLLNDNKHIKIKKEPEIENKKKCCF